MTTFETVFESFRFHQRLTDHLLWMIDEKKCSQEFFEAAVGLPCVNVQHFSARKPTINARFTQAKKYKENASEYNAFAGVLRAKINI